MTIGAILVLNAGSATLKFALYRTTGNAPPDCLTRGQVDLAPGSHDDAVRSALATIERDVDGREIAAVGHRVVHGGADYVDSVAVDARVLSNLAALRSLAPLHQAQGLAVIEAVRLQRPSVPQFASFDTAFHSTLPLLEKRFALPQVWFDRGVRRYGFHGLSYEYVSSRLRELCATNAAQMARVVVAHLGSGASLCAMRDGASVATTMSFTPTDGLMMATRSGALDPSVVSYLVREHALTADDVDRLLNLESGLLGVSGISGDMRVLLASDAPDARFAVDLFVHRVVVEAGAMIAALGGLDGLVFTGGIGTHQAVIRRRVCNALGWLGIDCDGARNAAGETRFDGPRSRIALWNIPTDEELVIAKHTERALRATGLAR
jgi:acetate kinase